MWSGTLGFIFPITSRFVVYDPRSSKFSPSKDEYWVKLLLRWISAALLALHHVNTRNASIVGRETLSRIPEDFTLAFKLADSKWSTQVSTQGAAEAIMGWTSCLNQIDFLHDACRPRVTESTQLLACLQAQTQRSFPPSLTCIGFR